MRGRNFCLLQFTVFACVFLCLQTVSAGTKGPIQKRTLLFPQADSSVYKQSLEFDVRENNEIRLGPYVFNSKLVNLKAKKSKEKERLTLSSRWPRKLIKYGQWSLMTEAGKTVKNVDFKLEKKERSLVVELDSDEIQEAKNSPFYFCVFRDSAKGHLKICSSQYQLTENEEGLRLEKFAREENLESEIFINDSKITNKGEAIFRSQETLNIKINFQNGSHWSIKALPFDIKIFDLSQDKEKKVIYLSLTKLGLKSKKIKRQKINWTNQKGSFLNYMPSIGQSEEIWNLKLSRKKPFLYIRGVAGIPFKITLIPELIPERDLRPEIDSETKTSTYSDEVVLKGQKSPQVQLKWEGGESPLEESEFSAKFPLKDKNQLNKLEWSLIDEDENSWPLHLDLYRASSIELSGRLIGVVGASSEFLVLGEVNYQQWFEDLFGLNSKSLTFQHWGWGVKYFQTLLSPEDDELSSLNVDLKYRLSHGVWGWDPSVGLMLSYQHVTSDPFSAGLLGGGVFWARSMPKFFDYLINWIPFFDYPKWVNVEFIYYPVIVSGGYELSQNWNLNFHGKIMWSQSIFGEGGFGIKSVGLQNTEDSTQMELSAFYATVGLGYQF